MQHTPQRVLSTRSHDSRQDARRATRPSYLVCQVSGPREEGCTRGVRRIHLDEPDQVLRTATHRRGYIQDVGIHLQAGRHSGMDLCLKGRDAIARGDQRSLPASRACGDHRGNRRVAVVLRDACESAAVCHEAAPLHCASHIVVPFSQDDVQTIRARDAIAQVVTNVLDHSSRGAQRHHCGRTAPEPGGSISRALVHPRSPPSLQRLLGFAWRSSRRTAPPCHRAKQHFAGAAPNLHAPRGFWNPRCVRSRRATQHTAS